MSSPIEALQRAITEHFKTQSALARLVGVTPQAVSDIIRTGREIPAKWCIPIDLETQKAGKRVSCHELRSDLWPKDFVPEENQEAARGAA